MTPLNSSRREEDRPSIAAEARRILQKAWCARLFGISESESLMQFAALGSLTCICVSRNSGQTAADRREVCRVCGGLPVPIAAEVLDRQASTAEIEAHVESLRLAGVRARGMEIPSSVRNVQQLHAYLDQYCGKKGRKPPRRPNAPVSLVQTGVTATSSRIA